jgi:hypothetical protein
MAAERLSMRKLRELFRLRFEARLSTRAIAASLNVGNGTVCDYLGRARVAKLPWPLPPGLDDDAALTALLFPAWPGIGARLGPVHAATSSDGSASGRNGV